jgi:hypothetical protein
MNDGLEAMGGCVGGRFVEAVSLGRPGPPRPGPIPFSLSSPPPQTPVRRTRSPLVIQYHTVLNVPNNNSAQDPRRSPRSRLMISQLPTVKSNMHPIPSIWYCIPFASLRYAVMRYRFR